MIKQTAVEFAVEKLEQFIPSGNQLVISIILEQAKTMEKEQIIDAWIATDNELQRLAAEKYYNETYSK